jgi:hypothetical protein
MDCISYVVVMIYGVSLLLFGIGIGVFIGWVLFDY